MKKIVTLLIAAALAPATLSAESKTVPYASALGGDTDWTVVNVNNDAKTWIEASGSDYSGTGYSSGIKYIYNSSMAADDWYISPAISLTAGVEYKVKFWHKVYSKSNAESYKLMMSRSATPDELATGTEISKFEGYATTSWSHEIQIITVEETGDYHFGFYTYSPANRWNIYITGFEVSENKFAPAAVSDLTCTPGANRALTATLTWTLPTTDLDGVALPEDAKFNEIIIKRDGNVVTTLTNTATEWTDTEATGLTSGTHTYEVGVVVNGAASAFTKVESKYIGPVESMTLPYDANIKAMTQDDFDLFWTPVKGRNSASTANWMLKTSSYYGNSIQYYPGSKVQDDWIISPQMKFTEAGVYKLSVTMSYSNSYKTNIDILLGSGTEISGYETVIKNITSLPSSDTDFEIFFAVETPGEYGIAFHVDTDITSYSTYSLNKFVVEKWQLTPAHVTDLAVTVNDDATVGLAWTNPSTANTGAALSDLTKVELYADGTLLETFTDVTPGAPMTYTHTSATSGVHEYYVLPYSSEGPADGEATKVKSGWVGDETQPLPYSTSFSSTDATAPIWSGLNANGDDSEWVISTSGAKLAVDKTQDYYRNEDYLLSPYFNFTPGYYSLKFSIKGAAKNFPLQIGTVSDKKDVKNTFDPVGSIKLTGNNYASDYEVIAHFKTEGKYAIAVFNNGDSSSDDYDLVVTKFSAAYQPVLPSIATDVTVTPAPNLSHAATISWTNPSTTNVDGVGPEIVKAVITRNDEIIAELTEGLVPGETSSYEDTMVPNAGEYVYTVTIHGPEGPSATKPTEVKSPWIGAGLDLPFDCADGFSDMGWNIYNVNNDTNTWEDPITWNAGNNLGITSNNKTPDDWAITPRLNFVAGGKYILTITSYYESGYSAVNWDLHFGTSIEPESMTTKIATIYTSQPQYPVEGRQTDLFHLEVLSPEDAALLTSEEGGDQAAPTNYISIPAGVGAIGLHANQKGAFGISAFSIKEEQGAAIDEVEMTDGYAVVGNEVFFSTNADVTVYDLAGKTMLSASDVESISLASLSKGVYIITATADNETITLKFVK